MVCRARLESSCWPRTAWSWLIRRRARWRPASRCWTSQACRSARKMTASLLSDSKRWGRAAVVRSELLCSNLIYIYNRRNTSIDLLIWHSNQSNHSYKSCWDTKIVKQRLVVHMCMNIFWFYIALCSIFFHSEGSEPAVINQTSAKETDFPETVLWV